MKIADVVRFMEEFAPPGLQESYDNSGLMIGEPETELKGILCTLDITEEVIDEAVDKKANLIIAHHPIIFSGLKQITGRNYVERTVLKAIRNRIALYAAHTNADNIPRGVNAQICQKLGIRNPSILAPMSGNLMKLVTFIPADHAGEVRKAIFSAGAGTIGNYDCCSYNIEGQGSFRAGEQASPFVGNKGELHFENEIRFETILPGHLKDKVVTAMIKAHPYEEVAYDLYPLENMNSKYGAGMIGDLDKPVSAQEFMNLLKSVFGTPVIRYAGKTSHNISRAAVCGGAGSFLLSVAIASKADVFVTGDIKYHQFFDAEDKLLYCDIGHFEGEQFTKDLFYDLLTKNFSNFAVHLSEVVTNPVKYHL